MIVNTPFFVIRTYHYSSRTVDTLDINFYARNTCIKINTQE